MNPSNFSFLAHEGMTANNINKGNKSFFIKIILHKGNEKRHMAKNILRHNAILILPQNYNMRLSFVKFLYKENYITITYILQ